MLKELEVQKAQLKEVQPKETEVKTPKKAFFN